MAELTNLTLTDYLVHKLLDHLTGRAAFTAPATLYIGLSSTEPARAGTNVTEPATAAGYARAAKASGAALWSAAVSRAVATLADIAWGVATSGWGVQRYVVVYDAATGGNLLWWWDAGEGLDIQAGEQAAVVAGDATIVVP